MCLLHAFMSRRAVAAFGLAQAARPCFRLAVACLAVRCAHHSGPVTFPCRAGKGGPDIVVVTATAAVGGLVALTGSLLSYAVARARGSRRERKLKGEADNNTA